MHINLSGTFHQSAIVYTPDVSFRTRPSRRPVDRRASDPWAAASSYPSMASNYKMKGFFKGFKIISQIFAAKEQEMVIGRPTDVKHVAHIGWSSSTPGTLTGNASPSWMNVIEGSSDFSSLGYFAPSAGASWTSQDFEQQMPRDMLPLGTTSEITGEDKATAPCPDVPRPPPRKTRRKKKTTVGSLVNSSMENDSSALASTASIATDNATDTNVVM